MNLLPMIGYVSGAIGFIATVIAAALIVRSTAVKQTIEQQKALIDALNSRVDELDRSDKEKTTQIDSLQREVDTFKNIPLKQIVQTQEQILDTQMKIIELLSKEVQHD